VKTHRKTELLDERTESFNFLLGPQRILQKAGVRKSRDFHSHTPPGKGPGDLFIQSKDI